MPLCLDNECDTNALLRKVHSWQTYTALVCSLARLPFWVHTLSVCCPWWEKLLTHTGTLGLQCGQGSPSCGCWMFWLRCEVPLAWALGSTQNAAHWWLPGALTSPVPALLQVWPQCLAVVSCPHCGSGTWVPARSSYTFAALCLWLECSCLSVVLESVYINHTNKAFIRNGPLNRII